MNAAHTLLERCTALAKAQGVEHLAANEARERVLAGEVGVG